MENESVKMEEEARTPTGGCSLGCASLFFLAAFVWPALHVIARTYEPEILILSFIVGGPSFLVGNILAILAWRSKSAGARRLAKWALRIMWGFVVLFFLLAIAGFVTDKLTKAS